ncbi:hypothetical protein ACWEQL_17915 [Kitasatospora sp. NPDC004240]
MRKMALATCVATISGLLAGCFMSDPEPPAFGYRFVDGKVEILVPLCPDDRLDKVTVADLEGDRVKMFTASDPNTEEAAKGRIVILDARGWVPEGFADRQILDESAKLPRLLQISYTAVDGSGFSGAVEMEKVSAAALQPGQYWTKNGAKTADEINRQLHCSGSTP